MYVHLYSNFTNGTCWFMAKSSARNSNKTTRAGNSIDLFTIFSTNYITLVMFFCKKNFHSYHHYTYKSLLCSKLCLLNKY